MAAQARQRIGAALRLAAVLIASGLAVTGSTVQQAMAHPHIWVKVRSEVLFENGSVVGFKHAWTFDEYYTIMAIDGLDANKDGVYTREELAELAKVNIEALKDFGYFTFPRLKEQALPVGLPKDFHLEHALKPRAPEELPAKAESEVGAAASGAQAIKEAAAKPVNVLTLHFTLPLEKPVLAEANGFEFSIGDPSFFIAFEAVQDAPITLGPGAPQTCRVLAEEPKAPGANPSKPGELMAAQPAPSDLAISISSAPSWRLVCNGAG